MKLIQKYNKEQTKKMLEWMYVHKKADFNTVYDTLGVEKDRNDYLSVEIDVKSLRDGITPQMCDGKDMIADDDILNSYEHGDYFRYVFSLTENPTERMILNIDGQENAFKIFSCLKSKGDNIILQMKFYAQRHSLIATQESLKYDKIVIYYLVKNRDAIAKLINDIPLGSHCFLQNISGFYDLYDIGDGNGKYVGIGQEPAEGDMSFTEKNTTAILNELIIKGLATYKDKETFANAMFDTVADQLK